MTTEPLERLIADKERPQRERLTALQSRRQELVELSDESLLHCLRLIRKAINSKKLIEQRDQLIGDVRRDGLDGAASLPKPTPKSPVPPPPPPPRLDIHDSFTPAAPHFANSTFNPELDAMLASDAANRETRLVYRDWLEEHGLVKDGRVVLGKLADFDDMLSEVAWRHGFIDRARLAYNSRRFNGPAEEDVALVTLLKWLLEDPGPGRWIRELTIGLVRHDHNHYQRCCELIGARPRLALEKLYLGDFGYEECELNWSMTDATALWPGVPNLRELTLRSGKLVLGDIRAPELRRFETITGGMQRAAALSIAHAHWPKLEYLVVQYGHRREDAVTEPAAVEPILAAEGLPALRHLGITNCEFTDEVCALLPDSKILRQLEVLDLSMGTMSADGARVLIENAPRFAHLKAIHLNDNYIPGDLFRPLAELCGGGPPQVMLGDQRDDHGEPGNRYASAYE